MKKIDVELSLTNDEWVELYYSLRSKRVEVNGRRYKDTRVKDRRLDVLSEIILHVESRTGNVVSFTGGSEP